MSATTSRPFLTVVLAAGQGTRMRSAIPKVLHPLCGRPMVCWPIDAAFDAGSERVIAVLGHGRAEVEKVLSTRYGDRVRIAVQAEQKGTGHAVQCALPALADWQGSDWQGYVAIVTGDGPLIRAAALRALSEAVATNHAPMAMLTATVPDATGYGRILRDGHGLILAIREHKDCTQEQRSIREFNPGFYLVRADFLRDALGRIRDDNAQRELYLTDIVAIAAQQGGVIGVPWDASETVGVNDRLDLANAEAILRVRIASSHARAGVTIRDLGSAQIDADVSIEPDVLIERGVVLRGHTTIAAGAWIDVGCVLDNVVVAAGARLRPYTVATDANIGKSAQIGPFSHLRPKSELGPDVHIGNFVETKATTLGARSKANHLAYLGDGVIGEDVNVGAGTIFCNYDGFQKHTTTLEDGAFIGSDTQLVAPVRVGKGAYVASGTTVTEDVPADALAISRVKQVNKEGFGARLRAKKKAEKEAAQKP